MKKERPKIQRIGKNHRLLVEGAFFTMQKRWLGFLWVDVYRYLADGDKHIILPDK